MKTNGSHGRLSAGIAIGIVVLLAGCTPTIAPDSSQAPTTHAAASPSPTTDPSASPAPTQTAAVDGLDAYWFTATNQLPQDKSDGWQMDARAPQDPSGTGLDREGELQYTYQIGAAKVQVWGPDDSLTGKNVVDNMSIALAKSPLTVTVAPTSIAVPGGLPAEFAQAAASGSTDIIAVVILQDPQGRFYEAYLETDQNSKAVALPVFQQIIQSVAFENR